MLKVEARKFLYLLIVLVVLASVVLPVQWQVGNWEIGTNTVTANSFGNFTASKDTYIALNTPITNYGTQTTLNIRAYTGYTARSIVEFDISSLLGNNTITNATLKLYYVGSLAGNCTGRTVTAYKMTQPTWAETTSEWNYYNFVKILGTNTTSSTLFLANYQGWSNSTASGSGEIKYIRTYGTGGGNVKVALADSSGNLLTGSQPTSTDTTGSVWNDIPVQTPYTISNGTTYKLVFNMDVNTSVSYYASGTNMWYKSQTYANDLTSAGTDNPTAGTLCMQASTSAWATQGGDYSGVGSNSTVPASAGWQSWDVTSIAQDALTSVNGKLELLLRDSSDGNATDYMYQYYSKDNATLKPYLEVTFTNNVSTLAATDITNTVSDVSATLNGNVTSGSASQVAFVYGTTSKNYPGNVTPSSAGYSGNWTSATSTYTGTFSASTKDGNVTPLSYSTTYYFRAAIYTGDTWYYGEELTFATGASATITYVTLTYFNIDQSYAKVIFVGTGLTGCTVDFGDDIIVDSQSVVSSTQIDAAITVEADADLGDRTVEISNQGLAVTTTVTILGLPPYALTQIGYSNQTAIQPFMIGSSRYIARSWWGNFTEGDYIKIYSANSDWTENALITTSPNKHMDFVAWAFPDVSGFDDKIVFAARNYYVAGMGLAFVATYDFGSDSWSETYTDKFAWAYPVVYNSNNGYFYIGTSYTNDSMTWYNSIAKSTPGNLTTAANWSQVACPAWGYDCLEDGRVQQYIAQLGNKLYVKRSSQSCASWDLYEWDYASTWTKIDESTDTDATTPVDELSHIGNPGANEYFMTGGFYYDTSPAYAHWRLRYSGNGTGWTEIMKVPVYPLSDPAQENWAMLFPVPGSEQYALGFIGKNNVISVFYLMDIDNLEVLGTWDAQGGIPMAMPIIDGSKIVFDSQNIVAGGGTPAIHIFDMTVEIETLAATDISSPSATLWGNVSGAASTKYTAFVWGTTSKPDPGNVAPASAGYDHYYVWANEKTQGETFSYTATSLEATIIYFRAAGNSTAGVWDYGTELYFYVPDISNTPSSHDFGIVASSSEYWTIGTASTYLGGYSYRKAVIITGQAGAGTNYPIKLLIGETSGATGEDFDISDHSTDFPNDIAFADNNETTPLYYWLESITGVSPNQLATFWVKVTDDLSSGNVTIYCYYGKTGGTLSSDGKNTFTFFEDFTGVWNRTRPEATKSTYTLNVGGNKVYRYRTPISVIEQTGSTLTGYPVKVQVDTAYLIKNNYSTTTGDEIVFAYGNNTLLDFYVMDTYNTDLTTYWVEGTWTGNATTTIYMYSDPFRVDVSSQSSAINTFTFFDHFTSWPNGWTDTGIGSIDSSTYLKLTGDGTVYKAHGITSGSYAIETKMKFSDHGADEATSFWFYGNSTNERVRWQNNVNNFEYYSSAGTVDSLWNNTAGTWYSPRFDYNFATNKAGFWISDVFLVGDKTPGDTADTDRFVFSTQELAAESQYIDYLFVRKVASTEPVVTPLGGATLYPPATYSIAAEPSLLYDTNPQILTGETNVFKLWARGQIYTTSDSDVVYAESTDCKHWYWYSSNPVLSGAGGEQMNCPTVIKISSTYYMYVRAGATYIDRYYSSDGLSWTKDTDNAIACGAHPAWDDEALGNNFVWLEGVSDWKMLYEAKGSDLIWKIGLATSSDGQTWSKSGSNPVISEVGTVGGPRVEKVGSTYYGWFHVSPSTSVLPTDICRASSTDLVTWTWLGDTAHWPTFSRVKSFEGLSSSAGQVADMDMVSANGKIYMMFAQVPTQVPFPVNSWGLATFTGNFTSLVATNEDAPDPAIWSYTKTNASWFSSSDSVLSLLSDVNSYSILKGDDTYGAYGYASRTRVKSDTSDNYEYGKVGLSSDTDTTQTNEVSWRFLNAADAATEVYEVAKTTTVTHAHYDTAPTAYHVYEAKWLGNESAKFYYDDASAGELTTNIPTTALPVRLASWQGAGGAAGPNTIYIDYTLLRKVIATEPAFSSAAAECAVGDCWPIPVGMCAFTVTNNSSFPVGISAEATDFMGGVTYNLVSTVPGADEFRFTIFKSGDGEGDGLILANTAQAWIAALAASAHIHWELKFETWSSNSDGAEKTSTITLTAEAS